MFFNDPIKSVLESRLYNLDWLIVSQTYSSRFRDGIQKSQFKLQTTEYSVRAEQNVLYPRKTKGSPLVPLVRVVNDDDVDRTFPCSRRNGARLSGEDARGLKLSDRCHCSQISPYPLTIVTLVHKMKLVLHQQRVLFCRGSLSALVLPGNEFVRDALCRKNVLTIPELRRFEHVTN